MNYSINETHDPDLKSWVESANGPETDFPIQNLPLGRFIPRHENRSPTYGVAIGECVLDLAAAKEAGIISIPIPTGNPNPDFTPTWIHNLRIQLIALLGQSNRDNRSGIERCLHRIHDVDLLLPMTIGDYTDFYASIFHATNIGMMFRPDAPLLPNYKYLPIGYHGRASSVIPSGTPVRRPLGQTKTDANPLPEFGPSRVLDFEVELGAFVGSGNPLGSPVPIEEAEDHLLGLCLVNDWSARDIQRWEYQPLGPFLSKSFATSVSPWIVTLEALAPFRTPAFVRQADDPQPLPYLDSSQNRKAGGFDIEIELYISTSGMRQTAESPARIVTTNAKHLYWTLGQMLTHHTSNGCNLRSGDLIASGTISGPEQGSAGCLMEASRQGPIKLPNGENRLFLEDGDEVIMRAHCARDGFRQIGFGECRGVIDRSNK